MKLFNNTPNQLDFGINPASGGGDCGSIDSGEYSDWPSYNNQENINVSFVAYPPVDPPEVTPFQITIPESGTGMTVTIGIYQE
jgi:hypothetical protein